MQAGDGKGITVLMVLTAAILCTAAWCIPLLSAEVLPAMAEDAALFDLQSEVTDAPIFSVEIIRPSVVPEMPKKRILIYHTHTWEAYTQAKENPYEETEKWRTKDNSANMVAVGDALQACLEVLGYDIVHDATAFEPPELSGAYTRSLAMLERRKENGEAYDLYIDLHRDAFDDPDAILRTVNIAGEEVARFMLLIGKGTGQTGAGYAEKPDWEKNYAIAERITDALNMQADKLARNICIRSGRYNQHIAEGCLLIECGSNHNTLEEVLNGVPYLAQAIHQALQTAE